MRRAVIVDAPDLPPEECEFYITNVGVADSDEVEIPDEPLKAIKVEELYEESETSDSPLDIPITNVSGIGKGTADNLKKQGINTVSDLLDSDSKVLSKEISGVSETMVEKWKSSAKVLIPT